MSKNITKTKTLSCGAFIRSELEKGRKTDTILRAVAKKFPASKATAKDVSWNRWKLTQLAA